jgi:tetrapyrrole methylase family protein/MazG family protein
MAGHGFDEFVDLIATLRGPDGCPWDREQTHRSLAKNMVEEAYEAVHAIETDDVAEIREELGDVLLQVVLHAQIAADEGTFTIDDVVEAITAKIVRRHPHVFGELSAASASTKHLAQGRLGGIRVGQPRRGLGEGP